MAEQTKKDAAATTREERLAAKLRENLRRRKAQGRSQDASQYGAGSEPSPE